MKKLFYLDEGFVEREDTDGVFCSCQTEQITEEIERLTLRYKNSGKRKKMIPAFEAETELVPTFYMIPCVNYNGNEWETGQEPKGMTAEGKPWIFSADRVGVPGCSIAEDEKECVALFSDNENGSKEASASVFMRGGKTVQRIYFSHVEAPAVYLRKFDYGDPIYEFLTFEEGEEKIFTCYCYRYQKKAGEKYYGYKRLFDFLNESGYCKEVKPKYPVETVKEWDMEFFRSLTEKTTDGYLSNMGFLPNGVHRLGDETCKYIYRGFGKFEAGWCGQNITAAEIYLRSYLENKDENDLKLGVGILDAWMKRKYSCGIFSANYDVPFDGSEKVDSCNEGWFLYKVISCCKLLKGMGKDVTIYENAAKSICGFFLERYPEGGFPQIMNADGSIYVEEGCAGGLVLLGFLAAYEYFKNPAYLERGKKAFDFYFEKYLSKSVCAGGALDTYCIDKESSGAILRSALLLYHITNEKSYLEKAENIAHYLMTWCFYHDVAFDDDSDCGKMGLRTTGGTSVSAAHHHIDCWGLYYIPDLYRLYRLTGNSAYLKHAVMLWTFTLQYMSDGTLKLHGMVRARGAQNEAVLQCNWGFADERKGLLNDWLVAWVKIFQLDIIYTLEKTEFFKENGLL